MKRKQTPREELVQQLMNLPDHELSAVLEEVFQVRQPYPEERKSHRNHFFLGIASSLLQYENKKEGQVWGEWMLTAVAYPDWETYPIGVHQGFWEQTTCKKCRTALASNAKRAFCPLCGERNGLT